MYSILLVDDDPWMLEYLSKCIPWEEMNITEVFETESGEAAVKILEERKINIVISDVKMGEKDGIQLLKEIKDMDSTIKVILLSGIDSARNVREAFRTGAVDFLFKPVDVEALKKLIKSTIGIIEKEKEENIKVRTTYEKAQKALEYKFYDKEESTFHILENQDHKMFFTMQRVNKLENILQAGKYDDSKKLIKEIFCELKEIRSPLGVVHAVQIRIMDIFYQLIDKSNLNPDQVFSGEFVLKPYYERLQFEDVDQMQEWMVACLKHCINSLNSDTGSYKRKVIEDIEKIIMQNLDKEISLEKIALKLFLNPSYLSRLFKENVGKSYTKYVMEKRIEKAKELLREENYKVYEVGELVGYENTKYFNKIFKEIVGITPKQYREKCRKV